MTTNSHPLETIPDFISSTEMISQAIVNQNQEIDELKKKFYRFVEEAVAEAIVKAIKNGEVDFYIFTNVNTWDRVSMGTGRDFYIGKINDKSICNSKSLADYLNPLINHTGWEAFGNHSGGRLYLTLMGTKIHKERSKRSLIKKRYRFLYKWLPFITPWIGVSILLYYNHESINEIIAMSLTGVIIAIFSVLLTVGPLEEYYTHENI